MFFPPTRETGKTVWDWRWESVSSGNCLNEVGTETMKNVQSICVFCGSKEGADPKHREIALRLGQILAEKGIRLIYGGGGIGLMGVLADSVLSHGGAVTGIIPDFLMRYEVGDVAGVETVIVGSMHDRKNRMFEMADAFVVLPGGLGTLDETIEITTWKQLRLHDKPIVLINEAGFWEPLLDLVNRVITGGYAHEKVNELFTVVESVEEVFKAIEDAPEPDDVVLTSHL